MIIFVSLFLLFSSLSALANTCQRPMARQVVDQLMVANINEANQLLDDWQTQEKTSELSYRFYRSMTLWTLVEIAEEDKKQAAQKNALQSLETLLGDIEINAIIATDNIEQQLIKGMAQAFVGRIYLQQNDWLDAYQYGRSGRDTLRQLIQSHPNTEDAYLVLGLYEYYTGSVPAWLRWLSHWLDLKGDAQLGLRYLERAAQHAPIAGPEAARMLLNGIAFIPQQGCAYLPLAASMRDNYHTEAFYSFDLQQRYMSCGHADKALVENQRLNQQDVAGLDKEDTRRNRYLALYAARNLADIDAIEASKTQFIEDMPFWTLLKAQTLDLNNQRSQALLLYEELNTITSAPWVLAQAEIFIKNPFQIITPRYKEKQLSLSTPCQDISL